ncbi:ABC transporter ATP-binding protein [Variovorax paradoxus]|uniref:ABC transporter ATP-binding protein n=1 Tax=Variovorax paradoxus TaxID=34073 RepID=UPI001932EAB9|nr:ABC transporter ATP-binding protein [Variovorax paradoxus]
MTLAISQSRTQHLHPVDSPAVSDTKAGAGRIRLTDLQKRYGTVRALDGVSLDIEEGSFVALLGPSGCGKTTLLSAIAGFAEVDSGSIEINGVKLTKNTPAYERNLGIVFQHYALFPHMTVRRNIAYPLEIRRQEKSAIDLAVQRTLAMVDLAGLQDRYPGELSGGQQQRVALARALVYSPPVLLLDEPLGALDRRLRDVMQAELKDLHRRLGKTFVYVTHDQDEALAMADQVVVMRSGRVEQQGAPLDLYEHPANEFVARFVGECNVVHGNWRDAGAGYELIEPASGLVLHRCLKKPHDRNASVAIRPEWMQVLGGNESTSAQLQQLSCKTLQTRFHGSESIMDVSSPMGELLVRVPYRQRRIVDVNSDSFNVGWNPEETVLLGSSRQG